jgi:hypothetical protein
VEFVLSHPCGLRIQKGLQEAEVRAVDGVRAEDMGTGYIWYDLPEAEIAGQRVVMRLCFFQFKLESLSVAVASRELYGSSWADSSEEKEKARAKATQRWLADVGYAVGTYPWGIVYAGFDARTGGGSGGVRFGRGAPVG